MDEQRKVIELLKKSPFWTMSREELLDSLMKQPTLSLLHRYFGDVCSLLQVVQRTSGHLNHFENHPYECLVFSQVLRFQRYHLALHSLFNRDEQRIMACFDGVHPILKALFELMIEARMVAAYSNVFGANPERKRELTQRVLVFADLNKKQDNYKFKYLDIPICEDLKSEGLRLEHARTKEECEERMNALAAKLGEEKWGDCRHWFPTKALNGKPIIKAKRRDFGSVRWRCEDVLGTCSASPDEKRWWSRAYVSYYQYVNTYSHPVLGYDDCFRGDKERHYDFFWLSFGMIDAFHSFVLPWVLSELAVDLESIDAVQLKKGIDDGHRDLVRLVAIYMPCIERKDRAGFQA